MAAGNPGIVDLPAPDAGAGGAGSEWAQLAREVLGRASGGSPDLVVLASPWVAPVLAVRGGERSLSQREWEAVGRHRLHRILGEAADTHEIRLQGYGESARLAVAMPAGMAAAARQLRADRVVRRIRLVPAMIQATQYRPRRRPGQTEWLVCESPDGMQIAWFDRDEPRVSPPLPPSDDPTAAVRREAAIQGITSPPFGTWVRWRSALPHAAVPTGLALIRPLPALHRWPVERESAPGAATDPVESPRALVA